MARKDIPDSTIETVAQYIHQRDTRTYSIPPVGNENNLETPQVFEITPFGEIDKSQRRFYSIDGSFNSQQFYNGVCVAIYSAGYICYQEGREINLNDLNDPVIKGKSYFPESILIVNEASRYNVYDELLQLDPVKKLLDFFAQKSENVFAHDRDAVCSDTSKLLSFCQEILEWALVLEIANLKDTKTGDFILRDGTLRTVQIKQEFVVKLGKYIHEKGLILAAITKNSPIKMELSYTFKQIDSYLQDQLKPKYPFKELNPTRQKLCCWFQVPETVLVSSYGKGAMYAKNDIKGGRGCGVFFVSRLDYVEKLQNYDWLVADLNIFDVMPGIEGNNREQDRKKIQEIFQEMTRLTQEHYILGYPYPLVDVHNFISLRSDFKEEIINRVKHALYKDQNMDNIDIENLFLDIHNQF